MPYIDLVILVVVAIFAGKGYVKGFFNEFLTFLGFVVAIFLSTNLYGPIGTWFSKMLGVGAGLGRFAAFLLIFLLTTFGFASVGIMLSKGAKKLDLTGANRALGAAFGGAKGFLAVGVILAVIVKGAVSPKVAAGVKGSFFAPYAIEFFKKLMDVIQL